MIIRISGDGQYEVAEDVLVRLNAIDDDLEDAVESGDEDRFGIELGRLVSLVREAGTRLPDDHLGASDLILPPEDISLGELAGGLSTDGLIPDWGRPVT
jgi:hypothetical protein